MKDNKPPAMESYVNCPECGELVQVIMKPYESVMDVFVNCLRIGMEIGKTDDFIGRCKCKCGKTVAASLHVTCEN